MRAISRPAEIGQVTAAAYQVDYLRLQNMKSMQT